VVKIVVLRAYGKKIVAVDFGVVAVAVDEHGNAARVKDGAAETAAKWEKGDSQIRLFLPGVGGVKKTVKNGRLYLGDVEVGQVLEVAL
jgi:23S rRNA pseudoU1915 N3-methylase RlmH